MGDMKIQGMGPAYTSQEQAALPPAQAGDSPAGPPGPAAPAEKPAQQPNPPGQAEPDWDRETVQEMIRESQEQIQRHQEQLEKIKTKPRYGDAPLEAYARLARARNKNQVGMAAGYARRRIAQLRSALRTDAENAEEIKAALRQLEKAVSRAGKKKNDLQKEELQEIRRKRLLKEKERQRAQRLKHELRRSKMMRAFRERGYMHEAVTDSQQQSLLAATRAELREQAQALSNAFAADAAFAAQQYTAQQSTADAGAAPAPAAVDVQA